MYRFLALSTAILLTLFVSTTVNFSQETEKGAAYAVFVDGAAYTNHRQDDQKFLPQKEIAVPQVSTSYSYAPEKISFSARVPEALNNRGPPVPLLFA